MSEGNVNFIINIQTALIDNDIKSNIKTLKESYIRLNKDLVSFKEISELSDQDFSYSTTEANNLKKKLSSNFDTIHHLISDLESADVTSPSIQVYILYIIKNRKRLEIFFQLLIQISLVISMKNSTQQQQRQIIKYQHFLL